MNDDSDEFEIDKEIDEIFQTPLTQRQINFLRGVLNEFIEQEYKNRNSEAADRFSIHRETLSRFAKNKNLDNPGKNFNSSTETLKAIAKNLAYEDVLKLSELKAGYKQHLDDAKHLSKYFVEEQTHFDINYSGKFQQVITLNRRVQPVRHLIFLVMQNESFFDVIEEIKKVALKNCFSNDDYDELPHDKSLGWGIFVRDDSLLILLKNEISGKIHTYVSITNSQRDQTTDKVNGFILLEHNDLFSMDWNKDFAQFKDFMQSEIYNIVLEFQRVDDFSGVKSKKASELNKNDIDENAEKVNRFRKKTRFQTSTEKSVSFLEQSEKGSSMTDDELGKKLIVAAEKMDTEQVIELVNKKAPVDYIEPATGLTAIHYAAGHGDWETLDVLLATGKCNLLIRDKQGRLPSRLIAEFTGNMKQCDRLMALEKEQGKKIGINPTMSGDKPISDYE